MQSRKLSHPNSDIIYTAILSVGTSLENFRKLIETKKSYTMQDYKAFLAHHGLTLAEPTKMSDRAVRHGMLHSGPACVLIRDKAKAGVQKFVYYNGAKVLDCTVDDDDIDINKLDILQVLPIVPKN